MYEQVEIDGLAVRVRGGVIVTDDGTVYVPRPLRTTKE